jgi:hypothetical protein
MKTLSLHQPWASLVAAGEKKIETRSWDTKYRGPIAIHASKSMPEYARDFCYEPGVHTMLVRAGFGQTGFRGSDVGGLPLGAVVATAQLVGVSPVEALDLSRLGKERILGNFAAGRFAWFLEDIMSVRPPRPARGSLGLWDWDAAAEGVEALVTGRLF